MKKLLVILLLFLTAGLPLAQSRASMASPVVKGTPEEITIVARFSDFNADDEYRIGVGTIKSGLPSAQITLDKDDAAISASLSDFEQGYTGSWWGVDKVNLRGFQIPGPAGSDLTLKLVVPRAEAESAEKIYLLVAKKYGENVWYVEDGIELTKENW